MCSSDLTKDRVIDTKDAVGLKEERERLDAKKRKRPKTARKRKKLLQPVFLLHPALQNARIKGYWYKKNPPQPAKQ